MAFFKQFQFLILAIIFNVISVQSMQLGLHTIAQRRTTAQQILTIEKEKRDIPSITEQFNRENTETNFWFIRHITQLQNRLRKEIGEDTTIKVMGSRRWNTNHLLSDIDAVIVTKSPNSEGILQALGKYYSEHNKDIKQFSTKTKAGLYLFVLKNFTDKELGEMRLEYTIQTPEINHAIIEKMSEGISIKFKTQEEKTIYALEMMEAVYNDDAAKQLQLKEWTRVL